MPDPLHFDALADDYGSARPPYPAELWDHVDRTGLTRPGCRALDLGAGTGEATGPLLARGMTVVAVEPGPRLAALLERTHPDATVMRSRTEDTQLPTAAFEVAVAATSIHWMNLNEVLPKIHRALVPHGRLLVWRNVFGDPDATITPFRERVAEIVRQRGAAPRNRLESMQTTGSDLVKSGLFEIEKTHTYHWRIVLDERAVRQLFSTFSDWSTAEVECAAAAVRELGGSVTEQYTSWLIIASPRFDATSTSPR